MLSSCVTTLLANHGQRVSRNASHSSNVIGPLRRMQLIIGTTKVQAYENTWKCGELKLYFSPSTGELKKQKKTRLPYPLAQCQFFGLSELRPEKRIFFSLLCSFAFVSVDFFPMFLSDMLRADLAVFRFLFDI